MKGLRVKTTFTFSAVGMSAPIFITVYGLNEREIPSDKCILVPLKGLCIGGGVNIDAKMSGYVLFMRKQENADSIRYTHYLKNILLPFVKDNRYQFDGLPREEVDIPDELSAVSWCNGDIEQIQTIVDNIGLYTSAKILANKHNPARLGIVTVVVHRG